MMVKICGITSLIDALAAVDAGATALGFNFWPKSPRYIEPDKARRIIDQLPLGVLSVGLFVNERPERVAEAAGRLKLDVVQLHGDKPLPAALRVWKALGVGPKFKPADLDQFDVEAFVLDAPSGKAHGGTGKTYDWGRTAGVRHRFVLAGGLDESNVREAIRVARPWGVDACSRLETEPGRKDHAKMVAFVKAVRAEES